MNTNSTKDMIKWINEQISPNSNMTKKKQDELKRQEKKLFEKLVKTKNANYLVDQENKLTLLMVICQKGYIGLAKTLIHQVETDHSLKDTDGNNAFYHALTYGTLPILKEFRLDGRVDFDVKDENENNALMIHLKNKKNPTATSAQFLVQVCGNINHQNKYGQSPLIIASERCSLDIINIILEQKNINPNLRNVKNETSFMLAVRNKRAHVVNRLLDLPNLDVELPEKIKESLTGARGDEVIKELKKFRPFKIDWSIERLLWIAIYKNKDNSECGLALVPKDIIKSILKHNSYLKNGYGYIT